MSSKALLLYVNSQPKTHQIARFVRAYREPVRRLLPRNLPVCINGDYLLWPNCKRGFQSYTSYRNLLRFWSELPKRDKLFFVFLFFLFLRFTCKRVLYAKTFAPDCRTSITLNNSRSPIHLLTADRGETMAVKAGRTTCEWKSWKFICFIVFGLWPKNWMVKVVVF